MPVDTKIEMDKKSYNRIMDRITTIGKKIDDMRPLWKDYVEWYRDFMRLNFSKEGALTNYQKWKPLTPRYAEWKKKKVGAKPILEFSGILKSNTINFLWKGTKRNLKIEVAGNLPYTRAHQWGVKKRDLPARPYFVDRESRLPRSAIAQLMKDMAKYVMREKNG
jgi:phage gpG-like protein